MLSYCGIFVVGNFYLKIEIQVHIFIYKSFFILILLSEIKNHIIKRSDIIFHDKYFSNIATYEQKTIYCIQPAFRIYIIMDEPYLFKQKIAPNNNKYFILGIFFKSVLKLKNMRMITMIYYSENRCIRLNFFQVITSFFSYIYGIVLQVSLLLSTASFLNDLYHISVCHHVLLLQCEPLL